MNLLICRMLAFCALGVSCAEHHSDDKEPAPTNATMEWSNESREASMSVVVQAWTTIPGNVRIFAEANGPRLVIEQAYGDFNSFLSGASVQNGGGNVVLFTESGSTYAGSATLTGMAPLEIRAEFVVPGSESRIVVDLKSEGQVAASCVHGDDIQTYVVDSEFVSTQCAGALASLSPSDLWPE